MAELFLTWDEAQGEQLPHYCVSCAAPATEWADWRICNARHKVFSIQYTYVGVTLPVCPNHRNLTWFIFHRVVARQIQEDGVVLGHVSPGFVEAVWDYREEMETRLAPPPIVPGPRSRRLECAEYDDAEPMSRHAANPSGWTAGKIVLLVFIVLLLAPCTLLMLFVFIMGLFGVIM